MTQRQNPMSRWLAAVLIAGAALAGSPAAPSAAGTDTAVAAPVLLKSMVVVDDSVVRLGDLFEGVDAGRDTAVARAPEPGRKVDVGARWLAAVAQAYGVPWRPQSRFEKTTIERASQTIEPAQIEAKVADALRERGAPARISLLLDNPAVRMSLPTGIDPTPRVMGVSFDPSTGRFSAQIVAPAKGTPAAQVAVTGRAVEMVDVPVLSRRVVPGEVIRRKDVEWTSMRADRISRNTVAVADRVVGMSPRRPIRPGDAILSGDLQAPIIVPKNSLVTIRLESPRMVLTAQGRALEDGATGDVIRVINSKTNKVIKAAVAEAGEVRVFPTTLADNTEERPQ
jgi:flagella basal body P-ring formation protein FlgA